MKYDTAYFSNVNENSIMKIQTFSKASDIWLQYKIGLQRYIFKYVQSEDIAKELTQQVLMKIYGSCCNGKEINNTRSWLFQIAHNLTIDYLKKEKRWEAEIPEIPTEENTLIYKEAVEWIGPLISLLPEEYALPLRLADIEGLKQQEVADRLGLSLTATKSRIQRARKMLQEEIKTCCHVELDEGGQLAHFSIKDSCAPLKTNLDADKK